MTFVTPPNPPPPQCHDAPGEEHAPTEEKSCFRAMFGCGVHIVLLFWTLLNDHSLVLDKGELYHLLWTFLYCKTYTKWPVIKIITDTKPKTLRKWIGLFVESTQFLEPYLVSFATLLRLFLPRSHSRTCRSFGRTDSKVTLIMIVWSLSIVRTS